MSQHEVELQDEPLEVYPSEVGCSGSLIPDCQPVARLAVPRFDGSPKYQLLVKTIRSCMYGSGRWPVYLRRGGFVDGLIEEAVAKCLEAGLLRKKDDVLVKGARSCVRRIIHREKPERRFYEIDPVTGEYKINPETGRPIRKSEATLRTVHPQERADAEGKMTWVSPADSIQCDASGKQMIPGPQNINQTLENWIAARYEENLVKAVIGVIGDENWDWALAYMSHRYDGSLTPDDHQRYRTLNARITRAFPDVEPLG